MRNHKLDACLRLKTVTNVTFLCDMRFNWEREDPANDGEMSTALSCPHASSRQTMRTNAPKSNVQQDILH